MPKIRNVKYKGLQVPVFKEGYSYKDWRLEEWGVCLSGNSGVTNNCPSLDTCNGCMLHRANKATALAYLVEEGVIDEGLALQYLLDS